MRASQLACTPCWQSKRLDGIATTETRCSRCLHSGLVGPKVECWPWASAKAECHWDSSGSAGPGWCVAYAEDSVRWHTYKWWIPYGAHLPRVSQTPICHSTDQWHRDHTTTHEGMASHETWSYCGISSGYGDAHRPGRNFGWCPPTWVCFRCWTSIEHRGQPSACWHLPPRQGERGCPVVQKSSLGSKTHVSSGHLAPSVCRWIVLRYWTSMPFVPQFSDMAVGWCCKTSPHLRRLHQTKDPKFRW